VNLNPDSNPYLTFKVEDFWRIVFECAGAATGPLLQDHPDYVFPSERVSEAVVNCLATHGITDPPVGYRIHSQEVN
jgi:hypothetical protein